MPKILIADDHPLMRRALAGVVAESLAGVELVEAESLDEARARLADDPSIELVLLDLLMPGSHGLVGLAAVRAEYPGVAVVVVSAHDDPAIVARVLAYGASGFIPKRARPEEFGRALAIVLDGGIAAPELPPIDADDRALAARLATLTPQQFRVLRLVAEGRLNKQIADELGIAERTIKAHLSAIFERLKVRNRTQASVMLRSLDLRGPSSEAPREASDLGT
jgi:DNA-binding NarL/FixJ family response regulator